MQPAPLPERLPRAGFTTKQARRVGVSRARSRAADLTAPYARTRVDRNTPFGLAERCRLLLALLRPDAFICGPTAAALHGMPLPDGMAAKLERRVDVAVPPRCRAPRIGGIRGRALTVGAGDVDRRHGFRVTTTERTWCDLGAELELPDLVAAGDHLISRHSRITTRARLEEHVERARSRRGYRRLTAALALLSDAAESPKESVTRVLIIAAGLPEPEVNVDLFDERGRFVARADLLMREFRIVIEYEGDQHRTDAQQWRRDVGRTADLESLGYVVVRVTQADLGSPARMIARIERHLLRRGWTPEPTRQ